MRKRNTLLVEMIDRRRQNHSDPSPEQLVQILNDVRVGEAVILTRMDDQSFLQFVRTADAHYHLERSDNETTGILAAADTTDRARFVDVVTGFAFQRTGWRDTLVWVDPDSTWRHAKQWCPDCDLVIEPEHPYEARCPSCSQSWNWHLCETCNGISPLWRSINIGGGHWKCRWCGAANILEQHGFPPDPGCSSWDAADYITRLGINFDEASDQRIAGGWTVVGGFGWSPARGAPVVVGIGTERLVLADPALEKPLVALPFTQLRDVAVGGPGRQEHGGGFFGFGTGVKGAVEGIVAARVLNELTATSSIDTLLHILADGGETYLHHDALEPGRVQMLIGPAVASIGQAPSDRSDPTERLQRLGQLHSEGLLTDDEFSTARAKIISELT